MSEISDSPDHSSSTGTEAQRERALSMLRHREQSRFDFRHAGIMQSGTRIFELRQSGHDIRTVARRTLMRHLGVVVYALIPTQGERLGSTT